MLFYPLRPEPGAGRRWHGKEALVCCCRGRVTRRMFDDEREESRQRRAELAAICRELKAADERGRLQKINLVMKTFQREVERLTQRAVSAEDACEKLSGELRGGSSASDARVEAAALSEAALRQHAAAESAAAEAARAAAARGAAAAAGATSPSAREKTLAAELDVLREQLRIAQTARDSWAEEAAEARRAAGRAEAELAATQRLVLLAEAEAEAARAEAEGARAEAEAARVEAEVASEAAVLEVGRARDGAAALERQVAKQGAVRGREVEADGEASGAASQVRVEEALALEELRRELREGFASHLAEAQRVMQEAHEREMDLLREAAAETAEQLDGESEAAVAQGIAAGIAEAERRAVARGDEQAARAAEEFAAVVRAERERVMVERRRAEEAVAALEVGRAAAAEEGERLAAGLRREVAAAREEAAEAERATEAAVAQVEEARAAAAAARRSEAEMRSREAEMRSRAEELTGDVVTRQQVRLCTAPRCACVGALFLFPLFDKGCACPIEIVAVTRRFLLFSAFVSAPHLRETGANFFRLGGW